MNIYEKINAIMEAVESLQKDGRVAFGNTKYNYLSEAKTTAEMRKQLIKHKLILFPILAEETKDGSITKGMYTYRLLNAENPEEYIDLMAGGQGHDSADKGSGKASSYAYKYLLWRTFAIPSNDDPDQVSSDEIADQEKAKQEEIKNKKINKVQLKALEAEFNRTGVKESQIAKMYKVEFLTELNFMQWKEIMTKFEKTPTKKDVDLGL